jgi:glycosyltransferase involved in cell wall biosynthesis
LSTIEIKPVTAEPDVSVVVPLLNEDESLTELTGRIGQALDGKLGYEIIFVDDGSTDSSWEVITGLAAANERIAGIRLRRNYGKSTALDQAFRRVKGRVVVTMDADLQDDPFEIPALVGLIDSGFDLVSGWKKVRHDPVSKTIPSRFFNFITSLVTGIRLHDFNCGLKAYRREVVERLELYGEMHRYIPLLAYWDGYKKIGEKVVQHHPRKFGESKFGLSRFINGFLDLVTLIFINRYLQKPMHFFGTLGVVSLIAGGIITAYLTVMRLFYDQYLTNRPMLLFGILFLVLGVQFFTIGLFGEMLYKHRNNGDNEKVNINDEIRSRYRTNQNIPGHDTGGQG